MSMQALASGAIALVTRPGEAGQRLSSALRDKGLDALWWPAFDLMAPEDLDPLRSLLQRLREFELAVFVSGGAVRGLAALELFAQWPSSTAIAASGAGTLQLARSLLPGAAAARHIDFADDGGPASLGSPGVAPANRASQGGSEALWEALKGNGPLPASVLIVRAESGREWLTDRLREAGSRVEYASVYRRVVHTPTIELRSALAACRGAGSVAVPVVTSSEAVAALDRQLEHAPEARAWLREGLALCSHPRIAQALQAAGYTRVDECEPTASGVLDAVRQAGQVERGLSTAEVNVP
jgi:uroporphyrinogen-III synthase